METEVVYLVGTLFLLLMLACSGRKGQERAGGYQPRGEAPSNPTPPGRPTRWPTSRDEEE